MIKLNPWCYPTATMGKCPLFDFCAGLIEAITRTRGRVYFDIGNYRLFAVVAEYAVNMIAAMETGFSDLTISMNIRDIEKLEGVKV